MENRRRSLTSSNLQIPNDTLDDICSRFLLNIPASEKHDMIRLCFQIELAHWFYLDFYRQGKASLPDCRVKEFAKLIFEKYPFLLKPSSANVDEVIDKWREYKRSVPTYGAVIMDESMEHVLLVQGFLVRSSWGFPKGKVNKDESPEDCAAREVLEETGFDIKPYLNSSEYVEMKIMEQVTRLYYVVGVPPLTLFVPKTRGEIKSVEWFNLDDLPSHKRDQTPKKNLSLCPNSFFMVIPFVKSIRKWVVNKRNRFKLGISPTIRSSSPNKKPLTPKNEKNPKLPSRQGIPKPVSSISKEEELRQRQYFSQGNSKELQAILSMKSGTYSPQNTKNYTNHFVEQYLSSPTPIHSYSASRGRGRIVHEQMPESWKNFKIDVYALEAAIDKFASTTQLKKYPYS